MKFISITKHSVTDHSGFRNEHNFCFPPNDPSLILGVNGAGKTSLLNSVYSSILSSLTLIVGFFPKRIDIVSQSAISIGMAEATYKTNFALYSLSDKSEQYEINYKILLNGNIKYIGRENGKIQKVLTDMFQGSNEILPIFRFFRSEKNILNNQTLVNNLSFNKLEDRSIGYKNTHIAQFSIQDVTAFIMDQINIENQAKVDAGEITHTTDIGNYIRDTLNLFTSILYNQKVEVKVGKSRYSNGQSLRINKEGQQLEFNQLSSGEKYVFAIVLEIIYRNISLNPNAKNYRNTPGIILIDELESHLHPKWQLTILKALQQCFPKIQFIVSSHSPLIASSVRKNQIIALNNFEVIPSENLQILILLILIKNEKK